MKREPHSDSEDDRHSPKGGSGVKSSSSGGGGGSGSAGGGGSSSGGRGGKRFRSNDENIRILVPSKVSWSVDSLTMRFAVKKLHFVFFLLFRPCYFTDRWRSDREGRPTHQSTAL